MGKSKGPLGSLICARETSLFVLWRPPALKTSDASGNFGRHWRQMFFPCTTHPFYIYYVALSYVSLLGGKIPLQQRYSQSLTCIRSSTVVVQRQHHCINNQKGVS